MKITTNVNALKVAQQIKSNDKDMDKTIGRLSTGKRLEHSVDNIAHLARSSKSLTQVKALNQVIKSSNDAVGMLQTAESGLQNIETILYRLKEISVQAASETNSSSDREAINVETKLLVNQIDTIVKVTEWNGKDLLGGTVIDEKITTSITSPLANQLSITLAGSTVSDLFDYTAPTFKNGDFSNGTDNWTVSESQIKFGQNEESGSTVVGGYLSAIDSTPTAATGNQTSRGDDYAPSSATYNSELISQSLRLYSSMTTSSGGDVVHGPYLVSNEPTYIESGRTVSFDWRAQGGDDAYDVYAYLLNTETGATIELLNETGSGTTDSGWETQTLEISETGNYKFIFASGTFDETFGSAAGASLYLDNIAVTGASTYIPDYGDVISNLTKDSANLSITKVDAALDKIIERRSYIGAKLSRIDSAIDKLSAYTANVKGALSSLENTDYAAESAALAKAQILREAGIAAITSAKTSAKDVLALLKISSKPS